MRLWILGAGFIIAAAINPEVKFGTMLSIFVVFLLVSGFFMDAIEFGKKWQQD